MPKRQVNRVKVGNKPIDFDDYRDLMVQHMKTTNVQIKRDKKQFLKTSCYFDYLSERITLGFTTEQFSFQPSSIKIQFRNQTLTSCHFKKRVTYKPEDLFTTPFSFSNCPIDFFGFSKKRIFKIDFVYDLTNGETYESVFNITLPIIKQTEVRFKPPGVRYPDEITRCVCKQAFKMNPRNSKLEIQLCILLEQFRIKSVVERYKAHGYVKMLNTFLDIENSFELDLVQKFNIIDTLVEKMSPMRIKINTAGEIPSAASSVCLTPMDALMHKLEPKELQKLQIVGSIIGYHRNHVVVELKRNKTRIDFKSRFHVEFRPNFYSNAMAQRALRYFEKTGYDKFMLEFTKKTLPFGACKNSQQFKNIEWLNQNVGKNGPQSSAVIGILNRNNFPSPYIVFGPPGTGKTSTLVEAVAQIVKLLPSAKVLVTVNSNSACDEIGERLLNYVGANKMFRFYSPSFAVKLTRVHPKLKPCSNLKYDYHIQPSVQEMLSYNVIIATLVNSGRLKALGASHFDFILIDECASSAEPYVDIPLMVAMKENVRFKASIVLLGDPKQLGQIMRTYHSEHYCFNISLMERVMEMQKYMFGKNGYDSNYIVQLTDNFRSHHTILSYSNKQFYNSILNAKQLEKVANFAIGWKLLPNPKIPIIFHSSWIKSESEGTSLFNNGDHNFVKHYVFALLKDGINGRKVSPKDIGIISPYAAQREKLKETFKMGIEIGTVEYFQGREKLIVVVSTVRSKTPTVGFLKNEKRLNVALTRAKALLIVIGNPETLGKSLFWRRFIRMCWENKAVVGNVPRWVRDGGKSPPVTEEDEDDVVRLEEMMNGMAIED